MKILVFYRPNSEHERIVLEYVREFEYRTGKQLPLVDVDSLEGIDLCKVHEILRYPTILAVDDQGRELNRWDGEMLPQFNEVDYYVQEVAR